MRNERVKIEIVERVRMNKRDGERNNSNRNEVIFRVYYEMECFDGRKFKLLSVFDNNLFHNSQLTS